MRVLFTTDRVKCTRDCTTLLTWQDSQCIKQKSTVMPRYTTFPGILFRRMRQLHWAYQEGYGGFLLIRGRRGAFPSLKHRVWGRTKWLIFITSRWAHATGPQETNLNMNEPWFWNGSSRSGHSANAKQDVKSPIMFVSGNVYRATAVVEAREQTGICQYVYRIFGLILRACRVVEGDDRYTGNKRSNKNVMELVSKGLNRVGGPPSESTAFTNDIHNCLHRYAKHILPAKSVSRGFCSSLKLL